ncbi:hypothetical protein [Spirosoma sordidisoli]|uniref:hypothetical protein n=1 Tax=Spirosoma sordidisoli TaxID=2502893 RepID=UPI0013EB3388|nr:hypothetical protein [Spirosoma sordidisoli]
MQTEIKTLLQEVTGHFPKTFNYASKIVSRLAVKGVVVTRSQVYNVTAGVSYNQLIAREISLLGSDYLSEQRKIRDEMKIVSKHLKAVHA